MSMYGYERKIVQAIAPLLVDNASATAVEIDTQGFAAMDVIVHVGATDIAISALKLTECDTSGGTFTDVSGGTFTTLPSATDDNKFWVWHVDLRGKKRFFKVVCTVGDGTLGANVAAQAELYRAAITPSSATTRGAAAELNI